MLTVEPITCGRLPESLASDWRRLLALSPPPTFQYDFEYMSNWTSLLRGDWKPLLLVVRRNGHVAGILPLMSRDEKRRGILPYRRVRFLGHDWTDFSFALAAPEDTDAVVRAALSWLFSGRLRWELLVLDDLVEGGPTAIAVESFLLDAHIPCERTVGAYFYIDLDQAWEDVWKQASKKFVRGNVNQARNRLDKAGAWEILANPGWEATEVISRAAPIHRARQGRLGRPSSFEDEASRKFVETVVARNLKLGRFHSHWLRLGDRWIAYLFGFVQAGTHYAWNGAFDPEFARFYPSRLMISEALKYSHREGLKEFNFMRGEAAYKSKWTRTSRGNLRFTVKRRDHLYGKGLFLLEKIVG